MPAVPGGVNARAHPPANVPCLALTTQEMNLIESNCADLFHNKCLFALKCSLRWVMTVLKNASGSWQPAASFWRSVLAPAMARAKHASLLSCSFRARRLSATLYTMVKKAPKPRTQTAETDHAAVNPFLGSWYLPISADGLGHVSYLVN